MGTEIPTRDEMRGLIGDVVNRQGSQPARDAMNTALDILYAALAFRDRQVEEFIYYVVRARAAAGRTDGLADALDLLTQALHAGSTQLPDGAPKNVLTSEAAPETPRSGGRE